MEVHATALWHIRPQKLNNTHISDMLLVCKASGTEGVKENGENRRMKTIRRLDDYNKTIGTKRYFKEIWTKSNIKKKRGNSVNKRHEEHNYSRNELRNTREEKTTAITQLTFEQVNNTGKGDKILEGG